MSESDTETNQNGQKETERQQYPSTIRLQLRRDDKTVATRVATSLPELMDKLEGLQPSNNAFETLAHDVPIRPVYVVEASSDSASGIGTTFTNALNWLIRWFLKTHHVVVSYDQCMFASYDDRFGCIYMPHAPFYFQNRAEMGRDEGQFEEWTKAETADAVQFHLMTAEWIDLCNGSLNMMFQGDRSEQPLRPFSHRGQFVKSLSMPDSDADDDANSSHSGQSSRQHNDTTLLRDNGHTDKLRTPQKPMRTSQKRKLDESVVGEDEHKQLESKVDESDRATGADMDFLERRRSKAREPVPCEVCGKLISRSNLSDHMKRTHPIVPRVVRRRRLAPGRVVESQTTIRNGTEATVPAKWDAKKLVPCSVCHKPITQANMARHKSKLHPD
jgi:hypothetical protein